MHVTWVVLRRKARHERLTRSLPIAEGEVGALTGAVADTAESAKGADSASGGKAVSGAQIGGEETMYALPHDSPAAAVDAGELRHLVRRLECLRSIELAHDTGHTVMHFAAASPRGCSTRCGVPMAWPSIAWMMLGAPQMYMLTIQPPTSHLPTSLHP